MSADLLPPHLQFAAEADRATTAERATLGALTGRAEPGSGLTDFTRLLELTGREPDEVMCVGHLRGEDYIPERTTVARAPVVAAKYADRDCFYNSAPLHARVTSGRGGARDVVGLREFFADLDVKPSGLASFTVARAVIDNLSTMLGVAPVAVVMTGHGLQPHWAIEQGEGTDWADENAPEWAEAKALLARWGGLVALVAEKHGGAVDGVYDLSRVLRVPGTVNRKGEPVAVTMETGVGSC